MIYLNNAGTSFPKPPTVVSAMHEALGQSPARLNAAFPEQRRRVCELLGIPSPERLLFTSGGTAALSLALEHLPWKPGDLIVTSSLEHHALVGVVERLERTRLVVHRSCPRRPGQPFDLAWLSRALDEAPSGASCLVAVTGASNVSGEVLPVADIVRVAHEGEARCLLDASQTVGVLPLDVGALGIDLLAFAGHKGALGPQGIGGFWAADDVSFESPAAACDVTSGGTRNCASFPGYCDAGSVNMAGVAGLVAGLEWIDRHPEAWSGAIAHALELRTRLRERGIRVVGDSGLDAETALNATVSIPVEEFSHPSGNFSAAGVEEHFARSGIAVRVGAHCAPRALEALEVSAGTLRVSFGPFNEAEDVERVFSVIERLATR